MSIQRQSANSAELSYQGNTHVEAGLKIRPLRDQIIVEPLDVWHSDTLIVIEPTKPVRGIVKAVGPGHYPKKYDHPDKSKRTKMWDSNVFQPTEVKVGDIVNLGSPQGARGYSFQTLMWGDKLHIIAREADVCGIETQETSQ